jgi:hypothetical protein
MELTLRRGRNNMAANPKPMRERQKKGMAMQKAHRAYEGKIMPKEAQKTHIKNVKKKFKNASKHDINMVKRSMPHSAKHSKEDLAKAHNHMKEHGG